MKPASANAKTQIFLSDLSLNMSPSCMNWSTCTAMKQLVQTIMLSLAHWMSGLGRSEMLQWADTSKSWFSCHPPNELLNQFWHRAVIVLCHWKVYRGIKTIRTRWDEAWNFMTHFFPHVLRVRCKGYNRVKIQRNVSDTKWLMTVSSVIKSVRNHTDKMK